MSGNSEKRKQPHPRRLIALSIFVVISFSVSLLQTPFHQLSSTSKSGIRVIVINASSNSHLESPVTIRGSSAETSSKAETVQRRNNCNGPEPLLRVYMYDLPSKFHFGLLGWEGDDENQTWPSLSDQNLIPSYPGGLNLQHSVEYWLTLDLLASSSYTGDFSRPCAAVRVMNSSEADVIFVPFFSSLSYNRHSKSIGRHKASVDKLLQEELVKFLVHRKEWKKSRGRDHLIVAHHPNSLFYARKKLSSSMFILADLGRYSTSIANIEKDIIAPYKHLVRSIPAASSASFDERPILAYFQGAIRRKDDGVIRQEIYNLLKNEEDAHFTGGSAHAKGVREAGKGMSSSKFCLHIAGDTPSSNRLFDAIATHCVPVIISDEIELPYEDVLDYSKFCIFIWFEDAVKRGHIVKLLRSIKRDKWNQMWERLKSISGYFEYQFPSQPNDAVDMIWRAVHRKKTVRFLDSHRKNRYNRSHLL